MMVIATKTEVTHLKIETMLFNSRVMFMAGDETVASLYTSHAAAKAMNEAFNAAMSAEVAA